MIIDFLAISAFVLVGYVFIGCIAVANGCVERKRSRRRRPRVRLMRSI